MPEQGRGSPAIHGDYTGADTHTASHGACRYFLKEAAIWGESMSIPWEGSVMEEGKSVRQKEQRGRTVRN